jgi:chromate transporter
MAKPSPVLLFTTFFKIGLVAYGGWSGAMLMVRREAIIKHAWITEDQLAKSFTYSQLLPGSTAVGIVSSTGYRTLGWPGLIIATGAYILPPALLLMALSALYFKYHTVHLLSAPLNGVYAALVGLLLANTWELARKYNQSWFLWLISMGALVLNSMFNVRFSIIVICFGLLYILILSKQKIHE